MATWTMPMYTAASPGTIAHRASVLQKATGVVAAGYAAAGAHCVAGVAPTLGPAPTNATAPRRAISKGRPNRSFIVAPFLMGLPRRHEAARAQPAERAGRPRGPTEPR